MFTLVAWNAGAFTNGIYLQAPIQPRASKTMEKMYIIVFAMATFLHASSAQTAPCKYSMGGTTYDFSKIAGKDFTTTSGDYTYSLNICGTSSTECQTDPDGITSGMAVQTKTGPLGGGCYVLSQYDDSVSSANWSPRKFP